MCASCSICHTQTFFWKNKCVSFKVVSFSLHNLHLIVLERCLLVVVMKFQDEFASLQQLNSPNSKDKFQICCINMYLNFARFCGLPEFLGSGTALNITQTGDQKFASGDYISTIGQRRPEDFF